MSDLHSKKALVQMPDKARLMNVCLVHCNTDDAVIRSLEVPEAADGGVVFKMSRLNIDGASFDYDAAAKQIQGADAIIVAVSTAFALVPSAFTTTIYITRTLRKSVSYFLPNSTYYSLVTNPEYQRSSVSLLIANAFMNADWNLLCAQLSWKLVAFKTDMQLATELDHDTVNIEEPCYCSCFSPEDEILAEEIIVGMQNMYNLRFRNIRNLIPEVASDDLISSGKLACALIFVTSSLAEEKSTASILSKLLDSEVPKVVVVINERPEASWVHTGLGLRLANELWVDCRRKPFYLQGEVVPSLADRLEDIFVRVSNVSVSMSSTSSSAGSEKIVSGLSEKLSLYCATCSRDSGLNWSSRNWPLPSYLDEQVFVEKHKHDPYRYIGYFEDVGNIDVECDQKWNMKGDLFSFSNAAIQKSHVIIQFWSTNFVKSFYCYSDIHLAMNLFPEVPFVIVLLDEWEVVLKSLTTMPNHENIVDRYFQLHAHQDPSSMLKYSSEGNTYCVSIIENSSHGGFEEVASGVLNLIKKSFTSKASSTVTKIPRPVSAAQIPSSELFESDVLISYCWNNSLSAKDLGQIRAYYGETDPRALKVALSSCGLDCWLDVERLGTNTKGLYGGIHLAMQKTKCVVLCVSDEYSASANCNMELQYAIRRIPCIVVAVGTGYRWRKGELGFFVAFQDYVDFVANPFPGSADGIMQINKLAGLVRRKISDNEHRKCWLKASSFQ